MADEERIQNRLDNIRAAEPILGAMRTISLGGWQSATKRLGRVRLYHEHLTALLPSLVPHLPASARPKRVPGKARSRAGTPVQERILILVLGTERGFCGAFNRVLARYATRVLEEHETAEAQVELSVLGSRARRAFERSGRSPDWFQPLPTTTLPTSELAYDLVQGWLERYETYELDGVEVIYNHYRGPAVYKSTTTRLVPPLLPIIPARQAAVAPHYVDTDPLALYGRWLRLWILAEMYRVLLDSAAAEHSTRFQLMEGATQNTERLIEELSSALRVARQQAITQDMQELAAGAGLLSEEGEKE